MDRHWEGLPDGVFYINLLPMLSIDVRRALKMSPGRLVISDEHESILTNYLERRVRLSWNGIVGQSQAKVPIWHKCESRNGEPSTLIMITYVWDSYDNMMFGRDRVYIKVHKKIAGKYVRVVSVCIPSLNSTPRLSCCPESPWR